MTFFAKKSHQKRLALLSATPSLRCGATCVGALAGCAVELTSLLCSCVQTATASQSTKHARTSAHATPQAPRRRRIHKGGEPHGPLLRSASGNATSVHSDAYVFYWAERSNGPYGCLSPRGRAEKRSGGRIRARVCLSAQREFSETPPGASIAGCPKRSAGTRTVGRAFFGDFLSLERKLLRRRAHTPAPALRQTHALHSLSGAAIKFHKITL